MVIAQNDVLLKYIYINLISLESYTNIGTGSGPPCFIECLLVLPFTYIILAIVHIESWLQFRHAHFFDKDDGL